LRRWIIPVLILILCLTVYDIVREDESVKAYDHKSLVRLHVVANSDDAEDQRLKLAVRDAVLQATAPLVRGVEDPAEARARIEANTDRLQAVAEARLRALGYAYPVEVQFGVYPFPEKRYGDITLPAGNYQALRVVIGEGHGSNWWCVLFPPLCVVDLEGMTIRLEGDRLWIDSGAGEITWVLEEDIPDSPVEVRFAIAEWLARSTGTLAKMFMGLSLPQ